ncbi:double-strand break repair helicase AddA [Labrys wisconsinensis]|uniref:DNA 3'-5' helicase n=1 Tax=Labrys wisconsinensis TaxID=425677 RepID=A0ABU0IZ67_9HYPH|nr:double-strand break repair helicase AddA [Labrys wisconsinensis]MDQ0467307.1 ATP-dependent helicase/nuclease subunit A [Labrys wisconsinensis]
MCGPRVCTAVTRHIPPVTIERQRRASDPAVSAWVSANAGSGKTTVLTRRVVRLLLAGAAPARILCLTFTKAAAANMQNRIFRDLGRWARLPDAELAREIAAIEGALPDAAALARARRLFAAAVETPGGLKLLTIHAFCERVLHLFPFEANVPAQFSVLDDRGAAELLGDARQAMLIEANLAPDGPLGRAMARVVEEAGAESFDKLVVELTGERDTLRAILRKARTPAGAAARLRRALGLGEEETVAAIEASISGEGLPAAEWRSIAAELRALGGKSHLSAAASLESAAAAGSLRERCEAYAGVFLTREEAPRATLLTQDGRKRLPGLAARLDAEQARVADLAERRRAAACVERSEALLVLAEKLIAGYETGKRRRAVLDFDDLVARTLSLLRRAGADWVLYKLDQGIDHILVDEAQDTSPSQWDIVERLAREFSAGEGARLVARTLFAVGDEKQSIYSFQGAAPDAFARMRRLFAGRFRDAEQPFEEIDLTHSFRSTRDVLAAVDAVFADVDNRRGLSFDDVATEHPTVRGEEPGRVEVWPVERPDAEPDIEAWDAPFDETPGSSPAAKVARRVAREVRRLIDEGDPATGARYRAGDVMVLVRSRNAVFEAVIRELKHERVAVAGADRLVLTDHIAVMDLVALARFVLAPQDDLTLAALLKTPLIGLDDAVLIRLAPGRRGTLWAALEAAAADDPACRAAHRRLAQWIDEAAFKPPTTFFADLLTRDGGRRAILARLGPEAIDALDEFLNAAANYERAETPSLQGFLAWLGAAEAQVKRDMDVARDEVRVMTVHGAKGLEARVVVLADTCGTPSGRHDPKLFFPVDPLAPQGEPLFAWSPKMASDPPLLALERLRLRRADEGEHRRLLYVAMTRAEERLVVTGFEGKRARRDGNWYDMIEEALRAGGARAEPMPEGAGERLVWERTPRIAVAAPSPAAAAAREADPPWLHAFAPAPAPAARVLRPSDAAAVPAAETVAARARGGAAAAARGRLAHRLLQSLPEIAPEDRLAAARRFLARAAPELADGHEALVGEVLRILDDPSFAPLFAPGGRAEVPIAGRLAREDGPPLAVTGRVDRLQAGEGAVLIADFKTSRDPPADLAGVPEDAVAQLAVYRALLARLYPGRTVRAALVWTARPALMELPEALLDAALARLLRA